MSDSKDGEKQTGLVPANVEVLTAEVVEAAKAIGGQIQINVLLQQVAARAPSTDDLVKQSKALIELAEQDAQARVRIFKETAAAVIDAKRNDPDEIDKRRHNGLRRGLKMVLAGATILALGGGIAAVIGGGSVVLAGLLLVIGAVGLAMLGPLASGESMSTNDVVQLVNAVKGLMPGIKRDEPPSQKKKK